MLSEEQRQEFAKKPANTKENYMNTDKAQLEWNDLKGKIKARWDKFVDTDLEKFRGNMHLVAARVESVYGITKDKATQEYTDFQKSLETKATESAKVTDIKKAN